MESNDYLDCGEHSVRTPATIVTGEPVEVFRIQDGIVYETPDIDGAITRWRRKWASGSPMAHLYVGPRLLPAELDPADGA